MRALVTTERSGVVTRAPSPESTLRRGGFSAGRARDGFVDYAKQTELPVATADQWHRGRPPSTVRSQRARASRTALGAPTSGSTVHSPRHRLRSVLSLNHPRRLRRARQAPPASRLGNVFIHIATVVAQLKGGVYVTTIASRPPGASCVYTTAISPRRSVV